MKYRLISKPVEAYQYTGHNAEEFVERFGGEEDPDGDMIVSIQPWVCLTEGDWLVIDHTRKMGAVSDANFKSRYEPAE